MLRRLELPVGTVVLPEECGLILPDGAYWRLVPTGLRREGADGWFASDLGYEAHRASHVAFRCRVGGNPHGFGPHTFVRVELTAATVLEVDPDELAVAVDPAADGALVAVVTRFCAEQVAAGRAVREIAGRPRPSGDMPT